MSSYIVNPGANRTLVHPMAWEIFHAIGAYQIPIDTELAMQDAVEQVLEPLCCRDQLTGYREVRLSGADRIDFLVGHIGIECKVSGNNRSVAEQLMRYSESDRIHTLMLVTSRASHMRITEFCSKPVLLVNVGDSF